MANIHSTKQKEQKRKLIMDSAMQLFQTSGYLEITMQQIAQQAHVAKGTIFSYFKTKEDLFMTILLEEYRNYFLDLIETLKANQITENNFIKFMEHQTQRLIQERAGLIRLNALRGPILESKANMEATIDKRNQLYQVQQALGDALKQQFGPLCSAGQFGHFFLIQSGIISGIMNMNALDQFDHQSLNNNYQDFNIELVNESVRQIRYYLTGYLKEYGDNNETNIRNFAIIAHIDHGKSTLADRIMDMTNTVSKREQRQQLLDDMAVEKEHGVTVKSRTVRNFYHAQDGQEYEYNLIDTPGHVDFNYEVSKSLAATEGAILLVDATQGVQAQTITNYRIAKQDHLVIIPVINKVDVEAADVERTLEQLNSLDDSFTKENTLLISAKTGQGVDQVLEAIKERIPAPEGNIKHPLKALVFDSIYNSYQGVIAYVRLIDGQLTDDQALKFMQAQQNFKAQEVGVFTPQMKPLSPLSAGEVGYVITGIKDPRLVRVGDTLTTQKNGTQQSLPGYQPARQMVYAGIYPKDNQFKELKQAISQLALNDTSFSYTEERSDALGMGFRCGFLGAFHLQIIQERLKDEFGLDVLTTVPNVTYHVKLKNGKNVIINNPVQFPSFEQIEQVEEPYVKANITTPNDSLNEVLKLCEQHKGQLLDMGNNGDLIVVTYKMPLTEVAHHFFSELKSVSHGYAGLETSFLDYEVADLVKVEVDMNYAPIDALAFIVHRSDVAQMTQGLVHKLKYTVPRRLYPIPVQAIVEGKAIARVDVPPLRKNAAISGEKKNASKKAALLRRQSINKRRAVQSDIQLPQSVFNSLLEL